MLSKVTVIGTGAMGTVCAQILAGNGAHVSLLARSEERARELGQVRENRRYLPGVRLHSRITPTADPRAALRYTELVIAAVPCQFLRPELARYAPHTPHAAPICSVTKGLELETLARPSVILEETLPGRPVAVLSGPAIVPELARCLPATLVVACDDDEVARRVQTAMSTSWFRVYTSSDVVGVELAGGLKNIIALAAGILDGLRAGDNCKAALITRGLVEITRLGVALGARPETFAGLAGMGDLITTCVSPFGRNRTAGERIARGERLDDVISSCSSVIEGVPTTRAALELAERCGVDMPITKAVSDVLFDGKAPLVAITDLMNRPLKSEAAI